MSKGLIFSTLVLSTALVVTGCGTNAKQGMNAKNVRTNQYRMKFANDGAKEHYRTYGTQHMDGNVVDGNTKVEMSQEIADKLAALPEIKSAHVALTNRNAYVAVVQENNRTGQVTTRSTRTHSVTPYNSRGFDSVDRGAGPNNPRSFSGSPSGYGYNAGNAVPRTGMTGMTGNGRIRGGVGTMSTNRAPAPFTATPTPGTTGMNGTGTAGTGLTGTGTTGTGTTGTGTGYTSSELSDALKNQVADIVKGMNPNIDNVYVTANADLFGRLQSYASDVRAGHPVRGFVDELNAMVSRIFPQAAGHGTRQLTRTAPSYYSPTGVPSNRDGMATR
ncbi:YhcN/YlaJ family sporulation lipoprotein [Cohnella thailandensis]|uniref:YhcN/YlaJ family sporulation lipoprotein n=1 Tax=Cohnella thailandensis TaxID=557557 RepID=A0A841T1C4_9BACL|nr:YhcN/YlaJ family sporulation lipoprotein [Cohnella thailandensis]MBB6635880.1 YhcN/YlaJ family sporulation lipoprotein [Cohnella thailandensis]MBP1976258.1 hypothetical protein [Cohnella thailandensis]